MSYHIGDGIRITTTFTDLAGTAADPTAVTCMVRAPNGTQTTPTVTKSATGIYYADVTVDQPGDWHYRMVGTGAVAAVDEGRFNVSRSRFS
jgi:hypothetical protein